MSTPPSQMSGAAGSATSSAARQPDDVSGLMAAIQCVLAEHNVADARFILELPPTVAVAATTDDDTVPVIQRAGKLSSATAPIGPPALNTGGGAATTTLLMGMQTTPATTPPPLPEHQRPPPRARSPAQQRSPTRQHHESPLKNLFFSSSTLQPGAPELSDSVNSLGSTARPAPNATASDASGTRVAPAAMMQTEPANTIPAQQLTQSRPPSPVGPVDTLTSDDAAVALTGEATAGICHVSHQLAHDIAVAEVQMTRREILQSFVGRSAILDNRRQREAQMQAQASKLSLNGILHPTVPFKTGATGSTTRPSSQPRRGTATPAEKTPVREFSADAAISSGSVASTLSTAVSSPSPPEPPQPQRRGVVRLTPPPPSVSLNSGGFGVRDPAVGDSSSLPSLISSKKLAVPGKTPIFSILNKDGTRLLDHGDAEVALGTSLSGVVPTGSTCVAATGDATNGCGEAEASQPTGNSNNGNNGTSHRRHSRPGSVSLLADDRAPPSLVHEPLLGTAAEEEANRQRSILVHTQPRAAMPLTQPLEGSSSKVSGGALPKLWSEQSKDNARRASQLHNQSRLSYTTQPDNLPVSSKTVTTDEIGKHQTGAVSAFSVSPPRSPCWSPTSSADTTSARASLRAMLQEQQLLQDASRRAMEEHNRLMQATRVARAPATASPNLFDTSKTPSGALVAPLVRTTTAPAGAAAAVPAATKEDDTAFRKAGIPPSPRASPPGHNASGVSAPNGCGIHVVKFTLPHAEEARQAAVQQLCRSSSGTQHVNSKERYRALLAAQQNDFTTHEAKSQSYKELLDRAVEFNRYQQQQRSKPS
ncbi:conserved hypothetical protein [Leishmania braziliensis MHOM/BR/75/M2904]|uniref:Uncharacterized protein n=1 Tax=Leishmania braziliensis TaxID=5660 RepID=A4H8W9_LEIBR|nr:conserved hypothetical protein [Leishmania braziliensis MHOM/BR/75/M2904]CAJ2469992.1 unnamed protein product [Leishmania braziliensis]CAM37837.2 conserved hypothetical protein [Leishmania braziliensis MHOM/BR/75/M2904]